MNIKDKVAVITGGASGMGAATAKLLHENGAKIVVVDNNMQAAQEFVKSISGLALHCDVSDAGAAEDAIKKIVDEFSTIHILVNCAGIAPAARIVGKQGPMSFDDFSRVIQINLIGTFNMMRVCAAQIVRHTPVNEDGERGVIINTASIAAYEGQIGQAAYSASKGGVVAMTLPAAREFARFGLRVMTIAPGIIATPMMQSLPEEVQKSLSASVPFPMRLGKSKEYAKLVEHIITNTYLNGSVIRLDAAMRMEAK